MIKYVLSSVIFLKKNDNAVNFVITPQKINFDNLHFFLYISKLIGLLYVLIYLEYKLDCRNEWGLTTLKYNKSTLFS